MSDNFGSSIALGEALIEHHKKSKKGHPYFLSRSVQENTYSEDPIIINVGALQALLAQAKRYQSIWKSLAEVEKQDGYR